VGTTYSITIGYDTTKAGKHAFDYLTSFDRTIPLPTSDPVSDVISGANPNNPTSILAIPTDPNVTNANVTHVPGNFSFYGADNPAVTTSYVITSGDYPTDSHTQTTFSFHATGTTAVLAFGAHVATRADWGINSSAVSITGAPYHVTEDAGPGGGSQSK